MRPEINATPTYQSLPATQYTLFRHVQLLLWLFSESGEGLRNMAAWKLRWKTLVKVVDDTLFGSISAQDRSALQ